MEGTWAQRVKVPAGRFLSVKRPSFLAKARWTKAPEVAVTIPSTGCPLGSVIFPEMLPVPAGGVRICAAMGGNMNNARSACRV